MSLELGLLKAQDAEESKYATEKSVMYAGTFVSMLFLCCAGMEYVGLVHTDVGWFIVDQLVNGESRFNPNGDIHGDWGNQALAVLTAPAFIGIYGAAMITLAREYFTGAAE